MSKSFEARASMARHVLTVVGTASLFLFALGATRIVRRAAESGWEVLPRALLLWLVVATGAALVALLIPRPSISLDGQSLLLLGQPTRRRAYRLEEIAGATATAGWPGLTITLRSGQRISHSLFRFRPADRASLLETLHTLTPAAPRLQEAR